jgi:hypothetical protein
VEEITTVADCLRYILAPLAEHNSGEQLALVTQILAETTLL